MKRALPLVLILGLSACAPMRRNVAFKDALTPEEHLTLAQAYEAQEKFEEAEREYSAVLRTDKNSEVALMGLGNSAFGKKDYKTALEQYRRILKKSPEHGGANNNIAMVYLAQNENLDEAEKHAKIALKDEAYRAYAYDTLAQIYMKQNRVDEARAALDAAAEAGTQ